MSKPARTFTPSQTKRIVTHLTKHGLTKGVAVLGEKGLKLSVPVAMRVAKENRISFPKGRPVKGQPRATVKAPRKQRVKSDPAPTPPLSHVDEAIMKTEVKDNLLASGVTLPLQGQDTPNLDGLTDTKSDPSTILDILANAPPDIQQALEQELEEELKPAA